MKNAKLLKSAVLSTALLFVGGAQAQTADNGTTAITLQVAASVGVTAGDLSFGTHTVPTSAVNVILSCFSLVVSNISPVPIVAGNCGVVDVTTSSTSNVTYRVSIAASNLTGPGGASLTTTAFSIFDSNGDDVFSTVDQTVSASAPDTWRVGGTVAVPANQAAGDYAGTYTFTATIS